MQHSLHGTCKFYLMFTHTDREFKDFLSFENSRMHNVPSLLSFLLQLPISSVQGLPGGLESVFTKLAILLFLQRTKNPSNKAMRALIEKIMHNQAPLLNGGVSI